MQEGCGSPDLRPLSIGGAAWNPKHTSDGTSTRRHPTLSAAAALSVWSLHRNCTVSQLRNSRPKCRILAPLVASYQVRFLGLCRPRRPMHRIRPCGLRQLKAATLWGLAVFGGAFISDPVIMLSSCSSGAPMAFNLPWLKLSNINPLSVRWLRLDSAPRSAPNLRFGPSMTGGFYD